MLKRLLRLVIDDDPLPTVELIVLIALVLFVMFVFAVLNKFESEFIAVVFASICDKFYINFQTTVCIRNLDLI